MDDNTTKFLNHITDMVREATKGYLFEYKKEKKLKAILTIEDGKLIDIRAEYK